ncbi:MAG: DUF2085 domain-containing protein [Anaerolineales bacterium]
MRRQDSSRTYARIDACEMDLQRTDIWSQRITYILTHFMRWFSEHWLFMANLAVALYLGLPLLAPVLMHAGHEDPARLIYLLFRPLCHQLPERSFFLYGARWTYSYDQLIQITGQMVPQRYIGDPQIGYKVAMCQRCVAIYLSMLLFGLLFGIARKYLKPLPIRVLFAIIAPLAIDGLGQLVGLWTSTWLSRTITGGLFGLGCIWFAYPYLERGMTEIQGETAKTLAQWEETG